MSTVPLYQKYNLNAAIWTLQDTKVHNTQDIVVHKPKLIIQ